MADLVSRGMAAGQGKSVVEGLQGRPVRRPPRPRLHKRKKGEAARIAARNGKSRGPRRRDLLHGSGGSLPQKDGAEGDGRAAGFPGRECSTRHGAKDTCQTGVRRALQAGPAGATDPARRIVPRMGRDAPRAARVEVACGRNESLVPACRDAPDLPDLSDPGRLTVQHAQSSAYVVGDLKHHQKVATILQQMRKTILMPRG